MKVLAVLVVVAVGVWAEDFNSFLTKVQQKYTFTHLADAEKLLFSELVIAAEENAVTAFIDRAGFDNVLKLFSHMSHDDAKTLEKYLLDHMNSHHKTHTDDDKRALGSWSHHGLDLSSHSFQDWFVNIILHDLPSSERHFVSDMVDAANKNQLTQFIDVHGYDSILSLLTHLDDERAERTEDYIIQHLEKEKAAAASNN